MMNKKINIILGLLLVLVLSGFVRSDDDKFFQITKNIDVFGKVYREITLNYVDDVDPSEFMVSGIKGMLSSLDPYTNYIDESMKKDIDLMTKGKYGGIGASVGIRNNQVTIIDLVEGYAAERQGLRIGDVIKKINETDITMENYNEIGDLLKGKPGTIVRIVIDRTGTEDPMIFDLALEEIEVKNVTYYGFVPENSSNGYIKLSSFSRSAGDEVKRAIIDLKQKGNLESIILDLRSNPGGLLDQAIDVAEKFLMKDQLVVSVRGRDTTKTTHYYAMEEPIAGDIKLAVLINGNSASASEIVAGAIQDHDRGVILGDKSFGKGLVQTLIPMSYNTSLKITTARYYTPSGRCIQKIDYSSDSKVLTSGDDKFKKEYKTDNNRNVFAAGGIDPDSSISNKSSSELIERLIAQGMFFKFATEIYNSNSNITLFSYSNDELLEKFNAFIEKENFKYSSRMENILSELKQVSNEEGHYSDLKDAIDNLKKVSEEVEARELGNHKDEVISEVKIELAARIYGVEGRIKESLNFDSQFEGAKTILSEEKLYSSLLAMQF